MKINLGCGHDVRDGYVNIDIDTSIPNIVHMDMRNFVSEYKRSNNSPVHEALLLNVIHQLSPEDTANLITNLTSILAPGGQIVVVDLDYTMIANKILHNRCDIYNINKEYLYRPGQKAIYNRINIVAHAESLGLFCLESYYQDCSFGVIFKKAEHATG